MVMSRMVLKHEFIADTLQLSIILLYSGFGHMPYVQLTTSSGNQ